MNASIEKFARQAIKDGLAKCTEAEQLVFKRMYSKNPVLSLYDIVGNMPVEKLDHALTQVEATLKKK